MMIMSKTQSPKPIYLKDYQPPAFNIQQIDLVFQLFDDYCDVSATLNIKRNPLNKSNQADLILNGEGLELKAIALNNQSILDQSSTYQQDAEFLTLFNIPDQCQLSTRVRIYPHLNTALEGLYRSASMFCTQCEAEGFRKITFFPDRPDVMSIFNCRIEADKKAYPILLSNGNPQQQADLADNRHYATWADPYPKPCYLFALVAGDLKRISAQHTTPSNKKIDLHIYVEAENIDKCDYAMESLIHAMQWDEQKYGREYDLSVYNIVAVNDFNMGAMENKGLNIFNSKYVLASPDTATDREYQGVEGVIAHEYFHNWTGNRITCRDWFQLSLKEGLTVFRDQEFSADMGARAVKRIEDVSMLRAHQFAEDASPMAHPVRPSSYIEINNFYTLTIYEKGAEVVRMQANLLGEANYRKATDLYFQRFDGQAVTTDDFVQCMADVSDIDFSQFKHWYDYAGTPTVRIKTEYLEKTQQFKCIIQQSIPDTPDQSNKPPFHIPLRVALFAPNGQQIKAILNGDLQQQNEWVLDLRQENQTFIFEQVQEKPILSALRGFSAPVHLKIDYSEDELFFLMAKDTDGFNRWNICQKIVMQQLLSLIKQDSNDWHLNPKLINAYRQALNLSTDNAGLLTELMTIPDENYIAEYQGKNVDVEIVHQAREWFISTLADSLKDDLKALYFKLNQPNTFRIDADAIAQRSLKNSILAWLMRLDHKDIQHACLAQYQAQQNMTDVLSALILIVNSKMTERQMVLDDFYQRWEKSPLVLDKWFMVQAKSQHPDCLSQIKTLMNNPHFSLKNPNKVRSLIGVFANANPLYFHAADGSGYDFFATQIMALDPLNPQISARMMRTFATYKNYDQVRQDKIQQVIKQILTLPNISKDLLEVAQKCLDD